MGVLNQLQELASAKQPSVFQVVKTEQDYEERRLESSTWVSTTIFGVYQELAKIEGFKILQSYIMGQNEEGVQLTMKAPILTRVTSSKTGNFESAFTVSMCVQTEKDHPLPEPTNQSVFIEQFPAMHVFVRSVEGLISDEKWLWEARKFAEMLQNTENVRTDVYFTATFENPLQLLCKNNEIWLVKYENEGSIVPFAKQNTMNIGHHRITMPPIVVRLTSFIISYVTFLVACFHICLNFGTFVRSNSDALLNALKSTVNSLAQRNAISRIAYVMLASALRRCLLFTQWFNKRANSWV